MSFPGVYGDVKYVERQILSFYVGSTFNTDLDLQVLMLQNKSIYLLRFQQVEVGCRVEVVSVFWGSVDSIISNIVRKVWSSGREM
jgi:hypothetical protein